MGTRADFYVGTGKDAEWVGSIAWDGYPEGITPTSAEEEPLYKGGPMIHRREDWPEGKALLDATTEAEFRERLARFFMYRDDVSLPEHGWPWPWEDSGTTDYAYGFDGEKVVVMEGDFPDMSAVMNPTFGKRSGLLIFGGSA